MLALRTAACGLVVLLSTLTPAFAQSTPSADTTAPVDSLWRLAMDPVVVTATRTQRAADAVAVPVSVIGREEIETQGAARATELLANQPGLTINNDHGSGLQMRGLGAQYTLILVDGEPIVGRTAGTLDLDRLTRVGGPTKTDSDTKGFGGDVQMTSLEASQSIDVRGQRVEEALSSVQVSGGGAIGDTGSISRKRYIVSTVQRK